MESGMCSAFLMSARGNERFIAGSRVRRLNFQRFKRNHCRLGTRRLASLVNAVDKGILPAPEPSEGWSDVFLRLSGSQAPCVSDMLWSSAGAFVAMTGIGCVDRMLSPTRISCNLASFGAFCALLYAAPKSPVSQKYNAIVAHIGCAGLGVLALAMFGPGSIVARGVALAAAIAFMQYTGSLHPSGKKKSGWLLLGMVIRYCLHHIKYVYTIGDGSGNAMDCNPNCLKVDVTSCVTAAALPLILIDAPKYHHLLWWYVLFPGTAGCIWLYLLQEIVELMKKNFRF